MATQAQKDAASAAAKKKRNKAIIGFVDRVAGTFAQAFLAVITVDQSQLTQLDAVKTGAVAGGYAVAKYLFVVAGKYAASSK